MGDNKITLTLANCFCLIYAKQCSDRLQSVASYLAQRCEICIDLLA